jgi:cytochrome P450
VTVGLEAADISSVPRAPGWRPLVGHAVQVWRDPLGFLGTLREHGDLVRLDLGTLPVYVVTSSELVYEVLAAKGRSFHKGRFFEKLRPLTGNGLANADGEYHRKHRRLVQPMFSKQRIEGYSAAMRENAVALTDSWRPGQVVELEHAMSTYAVETLATTLFSSDLGLPAVRAVRENLPVLLKNLLVRAASPRLFDRLPIAANRDFDAAAATRRRVSAEVGRTPRGAARTGSSDLLSLLLDAQDSESGDSLDDTEVRDELSTIIFAGAEATAAALSWTLHELATHPEEERKVVAEIDAVVGDREVGIADVPRLTAVRRALDEALRLHSVTILMRRTVEPVELAGHLLPAGTEVAFSLYAIHRDPRVYRDPERYDPDRWLPERQRTAPVARQAYIPFGAGSHKCIGDSFAYAEAAIALATILSRWRLTPAPGPAPRQVASSVPRTNGIPMIVRPRR